LSCAQKGEAVLKGPTIFHLAVCGVLACAAERALADQNKPISTSFVSPFNGRRGADSEEGKDFKALLAAYDGMRDAEAALETAKACKTSTKTAQTSFDNASAAFNRPLEHYVVDWSSYTKLIKAGQNKAAMWTQMADKVLGALARQDKEHHAGTCQLARKKHRPVYSEDEPGFMEGFQPKPQPTQTSPYAQPNYENGPNGPYYVVPPPPNGYSYGSGPPKPYVVPNYP
jgi:hypothetical protein